MDKNKLDFTMAELEARRKELEILNKALENEEGYALKAAIRNVLRGGGMQKVKAFSNNSYSYHKKIKAASQGAGNARVNVINRIYALSNYDEVLLDYLPVHYVNGEAAGTVVFLDGERQSATQVGEGMSKPIQNLSFNQSTSNLLKFSIVENVSEEFLRQADDSIMNQLAAMLMIQVEDAINTDLITAIASNAVAFTGSDYANSVLDANAVDVLRLMIMAESAYSLYIGRERSDVDLAILDRNFINRLPVLKATTGEYLFTDWRSVLGDNVKLLSAPANSDLGIVLRSQEFKVFLDENIIVNLLPSSPNTNTYSLVVDYFIAIAPVMRSISGTQYSFALAADVPAVISTINRT